MTLHFHYYYYCWPTVLTCGEILTGGHLAVRLLLVVLLGLRDVALRVHRVPVCCVVLSPD